MVLYYDADSACDRQLPAKTHEAGGVLCESRYEVDLWFFRKRRVLLCGCWCNCDKAEVYGDLREIARFAYTAREKGVN